MNPAVRAVVLAVILPVSAPGLFAQSTPDPAAAETQYHLAQRLSADGSPDAAAAFEKVVTLAPRGPLADDALVDLARLSGAPDWPEDLGGLDAARAAKTRAPLEKVVGSYADGDRVLEARYRLALVRLAPIPGRDPAKARDELIALAALPSRERWPAAARYALGVADELAGAADRAAGSFARIVVERGDGDVAPRAAAGLARTLLAAGRFGEAAAWFQKAVAGGAAPVLQAPAQRELALHEVRSARVPARRWTGVTEPLAVFPLTKGAALLAAAGDGRLAVFDRKNDTLQTFDSRGVALATVSAADVSAIAVDPFGRVYAATKEKLLRWDASGLVPILTLGNLGAPSAIAVDATGSVWIVDRKGDHIARWATGAPAAVPIRDGKGAGVAACVVSGGRLIVSEEKTGRLVALTSAGVETAFGGTTFRRPIALAVDAAGRVSVLDEKAETVTRLTPAGEVSDTLALGKSGVSDPVAIAAAPDGGVLILDADSGAVAVTP